MTQAEFPARMPSPWDTSAATDPGAPPLPFTIASLLVLVYGGTTILSGVRSYVSAESRVSKERASGVETVAPVRSHARGAGLRALTAKPSAFQTRTVGRASR